MKSNKVDISVLQTVATYAAKFGLSVSYIYKLVRENKMEFIEIDGVKFVDTLRYATIPVANRRK